MRTGAEAWKVITAHRIHSITYRLKCDELMESREEGLVLEDCSASIPNILVEFCQNFGDKSDPF